MFWQIAQCEQYWACHHFIQILPIVLQYSKNFTALINDYLSGIVSLTLLPYY